MFFETFVSMIGRLVILCFLPLSVVGQNYFREHFGATAGIAINLGSHVNAVGLNLKTYYTDYFFQINATSTIYFNGSSYGGRKRFVESRNAVGAVLLGGKKDMTPDFQLDGLNHQTNYNLGIGYNYVWYVDNAGTSQNSGGFGFHIKNVSIYHENDVFGGRAKDRFRTGHFYISYREKYFKLGMGFSLWTGETSGAKWEKIHLDKAPNGFKILEGLPYGKTSHGNFYGSFIYDLPYGQDIHLKVGVDSENTRHFVQNRLIHDMLLIPGYNKISKRVTPHYPRLDESGCPVFNRKDTRKARPYLQFGMNENWSN